MTEVMQWNGVERRDGSDRRTQELPWHDDRREAERRRGGVGVHHPNPTEALLRGIHAPAMLAFEPRAGLDRSGADAPGEHGRDLRHTLAPEHEAHDAIPSTAAIAGHPLHPAVVPLPIGAFTGALAADVAYAATGDPFFARAGPSRGSTCSATRSSSVSAASAWRFGRTAAARPSSRVASR